MLETDNCFVIFDYFLDGDARAEQFRLKNGVVPALDRSLQEDYLLKKHYVGLMSQPSKDVEGVVMQVIQKIEQHKKPCYFIASHFHADHFQPFVLKIFDHVKELRNSICNAHTTETNCDLNFQSSSESVGKATASRNSCESHRQWLPEVYLVLSYDIYRARKKILRSYLSEITFIEKSERIEFPDLTVEAFGSTDVGISIAVLVDGLKIFHAGDLNFWHWTYESSQEEIDAARELFNDEMTSLKALLSLEDTEIVEEICKLNIGAAMLLECDTTSEVMVENKDCYEGTSQKIQPSLASPFAGGFDVVLYPCDPRLRTEVLAGALSFIENFKTALLVPMHMWERPHDVITIFKDHPTTCCLPLYTGTIKQNNAIDLAMPDFLQFKVWVPLLSGDFVNFTIESHI